ncbi:MAG TPA: DUF4231 domain-containing protein [Actinomycetota bacterium]
MTGEGAGGVAAGEDRGPGAAATLRDLDLPELFRAADRASATAQRRFVRSSAAQLALLGGAALAGATPTPPKWPQVLAVIALFSAAVLKTHLLGTKPDRTWYEGRAAAESAKTLAWRYAVGGSPFHADGEPGPAAGKLLIARLSELVRPLREVTLIPSVERSQQITDAMEALRSRSLEDRRTAYVEGRLEDQRVWYVTKARWNARRAELWGAAMLAFEVAGVAAAVVRLTTHTRYDFVGVAAAAAGAIAAWIQTKDHGALASAYSVTAREISDIEALADEPRTESEWARFVEHAEEAISREHTLWRASRGT